jgi:hypothetical protein
LLEQYEFWQHQTGGLALFRSRGLFRRYRVSWNVPELVVVGDRLHLKPLLPALEGSQRVCVLALSQEAVKVFEVDAERITELVIPEMPVSPLHSNVGQPDGRRLQCHTANTATSERRLAVFHGHGAEEEDRKRALQSYFRRVDAALRKCSVSDGACLVLAGVAHLCSMYRQASSCQDLLSEEIHGNPSSFSPEKLHQLAWSIASAHFKLLRCRAADEYNEFWYTPRASNELPAIVMAARQGRVKTLFVAVGIQEWGSVDPPGTKIVRGEQCRIQDQDLLNTAAVDSFLSGGVVYAVPPEEVPGRGPIAAVFRY